MSERLDHLLRRGEELIREGALKLKGSFPAEPEELFLELTYDCPQRCLMCDGWPRYLKEPGLQKEELTREEIEDAVRGSRILNNFKTVVLTGGEPFLRKDLVEIGEFFLEQLPRAALGILTSCFQPDIILEKLARLSQKYPGERIWLGSSLDGLKATHDRVRGVPGSFDRALETLERLQASFPELPVSVNFTITPINYRELGEVYDLCREMGVGFSAQFPITWKGTRSFTWRDEELEECSRTVTRIMEDRISRPPGANLEIRPLGVNEIELLTELYYWKNLVPYQRNPRRIFAWCPAGWRYAMLNPRGELYFCPRLKYSTMGNVKNDPLDQIWRSDRARELREKIQSGACHCWLNCSVYSFARGALKNLN
jgi:MoaA/NifB/PqqE/SkfB family radical SAM enzyme